MSVFGIKKVVGEVTCEPSLYYFKSGKSRCNFTLTVYNENFELNDPANRESTNYLCVAYNNLGHKISRQLKLNDFVMVFGKLDDYAGSLNKNEFGLNVYSYNILPFEPVAFGLQPNLDFPLGFCKSDKESVMLN